jgi:hypothetical protein
MPEADYFCHQFFSYRGGATNGGTALDGGHLGGTDAHGRAGGRKSRGGGGDAQRHQDLTREHSVRLLTLL